ncbi:hypothetical protein TNCV_3624961 [Trichonephila clavipes]|nr:hypothetical protein TNCV_3624961 [Trichonephila clavipes]
MPVFTAERYSASFCIQFAAVSERDILMEKRREGDESLFPPVMKDVSLLFARKYKRKNASSPESPHTANIVNLTTPCIMIVKEYQH